MVKRLLTKLWTFVQVNVGDCPERWWHDWKIYGESIQHAYYAEYYCTLHDVKCSKCGIKGEKMTSFDPRHDFVVEYITIKENQNV